MAGLGATWGEYVVTTNTSLVTPKLLPKILFLLNSRLSWKGIFDTAEKFINVVVVLKIMLKLDAFWLIPCALISCASKLFSSWANNTESKFLPGIHIPVVNEDEIRKYKPDYLVILPWNLKDEISAQLNYVRTWDAQFVVAVPTIQVF